MLPFRTEIRNNPKRQTLKIYVSDTTCDQDCKNLIESVNGVEAVEIQESISRNRVKENLTIFIKENSDINRVKMLIENKLDQHFAFD